MTTPQEVEKLAMECHALFHKGNSIALPELAFENLPYWCQNDWKKLATHVLSREANLTAENARLREALGEYGEHTCACDKYNFPLDKCTCGLDAALKGPNEL